MMETIETSRRRADMLKGGVVMNVRTAEQAKIAEEAGAVAVAVLPSFACTASTIRRMPSPSVIREITNAVSLPVMASCRFGHQVEARILAALDVDFINESLLLTPLEGVKPIDKTSFDCPFASEVTSFKDALQRVAEGASLVILCGDGGSGDVALAARRVTEFKAALSDLLALTETALPHFAQEQGVPLSLVSSIHKAGTFPVAVFAAGGVATPADAALLMMLGADGIFVGSGVFGSANPRQYADALVEAVAHWHEPKKLVEISEGLSEPLKGGH